MSITQEQLEVTLATALAVNNSELVGTFANTFTRINQDLTDEIVAVQTEVGHLRQDVQAGDSRVMEHVNQAIANAVGHLGRAMHAGFAEQEERVRHMITTEAETRALRGMYERERAHNRRLHSVEVLQTDDWARLEMLENRMLELEAKLDLLRPPPSSNN